MLLRGVTILRRIFIAFTVQCDSQSRKHVVLPELIQMNQSTDAAAEKLTEGDLFQPTTTTLSGTEVTNLDVMYFPLSLIF